MTWERVCELDEIVPERGAACLVDGEQVALFRLAGDEVAAVGNLDPFSHANVISRGIVGTAKGRWFVASPMYKNRFDLLTGRCHEDDAVSLRVFSTRVQDGAVYVAVAKE
ncbi:MAG: nitrite reductase small subunit NirD [Candidatus Nanopelagicales bacterium]